MADEKQLIDIEGLSHFKSKLDNEYNEKFKSKSDSTDLVGAVRYDTAQVLTPEQKAQAKANLGITEGGGSGGSGENEIIILTASIVDDEHATLDEASLEALNNYTGDKPIYLNVDGMWFSYIGEGRFYLYLADSFALVVVDTDSGVCSIEFRSLSGINIEQDFDGSRQELEDTVPSRQAVMMYIAGNCAMLDANGTVPSNRLPSYVDDVIEGYYYEEQACFYEDIGYYEGKIVSWNRSITGEAGKIYLDLLTNNTYRWSGTQYVRINPDEYTVATNADIDALFT